VAVALGKAARSSSSPAVGTFAPGQWFRVLLLQRRLNHERGGAAPGQPALTASFAGSARRHRSRHRPGREQQADAHFRAFLDVRGGWRMLTNVACATTQQGAIDVPLYWMQPHHSGLSSTESGTSGRASCASRSRVHPPPRSTVSARHRQRSDRLRPATQFRPGERWDWPSFTDTTTATRPPRSTSPRSLGLVTLHGNLVIGQATTPGSYAFAILYA
jgi:hypothetical protein